MINNYNTNKSIIVNNTVLNPKTKRFEDIKIDISNTKKTNTFNGVDNILTNKNNNGYSIYYILNDFLINRQEDNLLYFNRFGFDIDYVDYDLETLIEIIKNNIGIEPTSINKTFKGYHIIFDLEEDLKLLDKEQYKEVYYLINDKLGGDPNMVSITGILKEPGYLDKKDNRDFLITNVYKSNNKITKTEIELILGEEAIIDTERELKALKSTKNRQIRQSRIEQISVLELIDYLNKELNYNIKINGNGIDNTDGLKIEKNEKGIWYINDFAGKGRSGIKGFINNYVLNIKYGEDNDKKQKERIKIYNKFGISSNENHEILKLETGLIISGKNNEIFYENNGINEINNIIVKNEDLGDLYKIILTINKLTNNNLTEDTIIYENDILNTLGLYIDSKNKKKLREKLLKISYLKKEVIYKDMINGKIKEIKTNKNILEYDLIEGLENGKVGYRFRKISGFIKLTNINENLLSIKKGNNFLGALYLLDNLHISSKFKVKIEKLKELFNINSDIGIIKTLTNLKKEKLIKNYKKEGNYIIYY